MPAEPETIIIAHLTIDPRLQLRAAMSDDAVKDYADNLFDLPPIQVIKEEKTLWVWDGFHSVAAHVKNKQKQIRAVIAPGTFMDALEKAAGANASHGLQRSKEDKRKAVMTLLGYELWQERSDRMIADACRVSHGLVSAVRALMDSSKKVDEEASKDGEDSDDSSKNGSSTGQMANRKPKRKGKDGKVRTTKPPAPLKCDRCKRKKLDNPECPACLALRRHAGERQTEQGNKEPDAPDAVLDDEGNMVPAELRAAFGDKEIYRSAEVGAFKMAVLFTELESKPSYRDANKQQQDDKYRYSNLFRTAGLKARNLRPSVVCAKCSGSGCATCKKKGYLTVAEKEETTGK